MKKLILCVFFVIPNIYGIMFNDFLEAIKASNLEKIQQLMLKEQLSTAEKKILLNYAKQTVVKRQEKIDKRNNNIMIATAMKSTGIGVPFGLYLDSRGSGAVLGVGIAGLGTKISWAMFKRGSFHSAFMTLIGTGTGILGSYGLEKFLWWKARKTDETLRANHANAMQIRDLLLHQFKN